MSLTPAALIFDVNETLSDMAPLAGAFEQSGLPGSAARLWFAELLRDGFALTAAGDNHGFADIATQSLHRQLRATLGAGDYEESVAHIMETFANLELHPDVTAGIKTMSRSAQLLTLSNGPSTTARSLLHKGGIDDLFSHFLSVQDAPRWKPAPEAYEYAAHKTQHQVEDLLLVAVHPWDIHGASAAGLRTAWINRTGATYPEYFAAPEIEAENMVTLARILSAS